MYAFFIDRTKPMYVLALEAQSGMFPMSALLEYLLSLPGNQ